MSDDARTRTPLWVYLLAGATMYDLLPERKMIAQVLAAWLGG